MTYPSQPDLAAVRAAWERFTQTGQLGPDLNPLVRVSWQRCAPRLNPHRPPRWAVLSDAILALTERQSRPLIEIARPILEDIHQQIETAGAVLALVDSTTCVLEMVGDSGMLARARALSWPNAITPADFTGWDGEFAANVPAAFDRRYATMLSIGDAGDEPSAAAILTARVGRGSVTYSALSLESQLDNAVPGAARLLVNLLSAGLPRTSR